MKSIEQRRSIYNDGDPQTDMKPSLGADGETIQKGDFHTLDNNLNNDNYGAKERTAAISGVGFNWKQFELEEPNYLSHLCWRGQNPIDNYNALSDCGFIACTDNQLQVFHLCHSIDHDEDSQNLTFSHLQTIDAYESKVVNMCTMVDYDHVVTCSREPVIKMFNI